MRPDYVSALFLVIALILFAFSMRRSGLGKGPTAIAQRTRRRTASIFVLVSAGLLALDLLSR